MKEMIKKFLILSLIIFMFGCATNQKTTKYNIEEYPNSLLVKMSEESGISLEMMSKNIWTIIETEILIGKFTKEEVQNYIDEYKPFINENLTYIALNEFVTNYFRKIVNNEDESISQAAIIAYVLVKNNLNIPMVDNKLSSDDLLILQNFVTKIENNLSLIP